MPVSATFLPCKSNNVADTISNEWQRQRDTARTLRELSLQREPCTQTGFAKASAVICLLERAQARQQCSFSVCVCRALARGAIARSLSEVNTLSLRKALLCSCWSSKLLPLPAAFPAVAHHAAASPSVSLADVPLPCLWDEVRGGTLRLVFLFPPSVPARPGFPSLQASDPPRHQKPQHSPGLAWICQAGWVLLASLSRGGLRTGGAFEGLPAPQEWCLWQCRLPCCKRRAQPRGAGRSGWQEGVRRGFGLYVSLPKQGSFRGLTKSHGVKLGAFAKWPMPYFLSAGLGNASVAPFAAGLHTAFLDIARVGNSSVCFPK